MEAARLVSSVPPPRDPAAAVADRAVYTAVLLFPVLVLAGGAAGYLFAPTIHLASGWANPLLGVVMFGMGLTLRPVDFALVAKRPVPIVVGVAAQYIVMALLALLVSWLLRLPPELAAGVILVGCAPDGTASNVVSYLARGDVAVSVLGIAAIVAIVVSGSADRILEAGLLVLLAVAVHNVLGYTLGYLIGRATGQPVPARRAFHRRRRRPHPFLTGRSTPAGNCR